MGFLDLPQQGGEPGPAGARGSKWFEGTGVPGPQTGQANGDFYINDVNGDFYELVADVWTLRGTITGPQGEQGEEGPEGPEGPQGDTGATGTRGTKMYSAAGAPGVIGGQLNGDFYLNETNGDIYELVGGVWTVTANIKGPQGDTGLTGDDGPQGDPGTAATVAVGDVTTMGTGEPADVVNVGTSSAAELDFYLPRGEKGSAGEVGPLGGYAAFRAGASPTAEDVFLTANINSDYAITLIGDVDIDIVDNFSKGCAISLMLIQANGGTWEVEFPPEWFGVGDLSLTTTEGEWDQLIIWRSSLGYHIRHVATGELPAGFWSPDFLPGTHVEWFDADSVVGAELGDTVTQWDNLFGGTDPTIVGTAEEVQTVTITGTPTGGTFTLTFSGQTTSAIAYNADATTVQTALIALSNIAGGDVVVTGGPGPGTPYIVTFGGAYVDTNVPQMTANGASLTGGTSPAITVATTTQGGGGPILRRAGGANRKYVEFNGTASLDHDHGSGGSAPFTIAMVVRSELPNGIVVSSSSTNEFSLYTASDDWRMSNQGGNEIGTSTRTGTWQTVIACVATPAATETYIHVDGTTQIASAGTLFTSRRTRLFRTQGGSFSEGEIATFIKVFAEIDPDDAAFTSLKNYLDDIRDELNA